MTSWKFVCAVAALAVFAVSSKALTSVLPNGTVVLTNANGIEIHVLPVGMVIQKLIRPDKLGNMDDCVLGFDTFEPYENGTSPYFGAVVGRVANRIADGEFELGGEEYQLTKNDGNNTLHGGTFGWNRHIFDLEPLGNAVVMGTMTSPNGDQGFPGTVNVTVVYNLTDSDELHMEFFAVSDDATPINMAQHSYHNLNGALTGSTILDNYLAINGDIVTPTNAEFIPTGEILPVAGTPWDFTTPQTIGERIAEVTFPPPYGGYDINYGLFDLKETEAADLTVGCTLLGLEPELAATVYSPATGRQLEVFTNSPGLQFYSGNQLTTLNVTGKGGVTYPKYGALVLETQIWPNAVNTPAFPQCILYPGEVYHTHDIYKFTIADTPTAITATLG